MFDKILNLVKNIFHVNGKVDNSKEAAKERLHLVLIQDRASVSADFLEVMKQEIIDVIKKYIEIDESAIDVRLTNNVNEDGKTSSPALYANFPITNVKTKILKEDEIVSNSENVDNKESEEQANTIAKNNIDDNIKEKEETEKVNENNNDAVSNVEENK